MATSGTQDCGCGSSKSSLGTADACSATLPDDPTCALNYHFGMLLGVDDFRAEQGFHVGHARRHARELHGAGVVWGYGVARHATRPELRVEPGFAVDHAGRDLWLDTAQCLSLVEWWKAHRSDAAFEGTDRKNLTFDADVMLCYRTCLSAPVPAIAAQCASGAADVAYSRVCEKVWLGLLPRVAGADPAPPDTRYRLLRLFLKLPVAGQRTEAEAEDEAWLMARRDAIRDLPSNERTGALEALFAAVIARAAARSAEPKPATSDNELCPEGLSIAVVRNIRVQTASGEDGEQITVTLDPGDISIEARRTLLPLDQVAAALLRAGVAGEMPFAGPIVVSATLDAAGAALTIVFDQPLAGASVTAQAFAVSQFTDSGYAIFTLPALPDAAGTTPTSVTLPLGAAATGERLRLTVRGTGSTPLLGKNLVPAGARDPSGDGLDLTTIISQG